MAQGRTKHQTHMRFPVWTICLGSFIFVETGSVPSPVVSQWALILRTCRLVRAAEYVTLVSAPSPHGATSIHVYRPSLYVRFQAREAAFRVAGCDSREPQGATRRHRKVRFVDVARCDVRVSHGAKLGNCKAQPPPVAPCKDFLNYFAQNRTSSQSRRQYI